MTDLVALNAVAHALHAELYPDDFKQQADAAELAVMFNGLIADEAQVVAIYREGRAAKGYVWFEVQERVETPLTPRSRRLYIHHLSVDDTQRQRGIGTDLIRWAEAHAASLGIKQIAVDHWLSNGAARTFFSRKGFSPFRVIMRKYLTSCE